MADGSMQKYVERQLFTADRGCRLHRLHPAADGARHGERREARPDFHHHVLARGRDGAHNVIYN